MKQRGKKSRAALTLVTPIGERRPEPPAELNDEQSDVWRSVASALPADWFKPDQFAILVEYCRHIVRSRQIDRQLEELLAGDWDANIKLIERLMKMAAAETVQINSLARSMRLTQQSRVHKETAGVSSASEAIGKRPWERG